ncbi:MAG: AEC family transporter [Pseudomonadales bacterium]|nr:AEC family transporter [Pseudomonadales bacterium]
MSYLALLAETFIVTGPIFLIVVLGIVLKRLDVMNDAFVAQSSRIVFSICLPVLLFTSISGLSLGEDLDMGIVNFSLFASIGTFLLSWLVAMLAVWPREDRGVFVQGCFRSNLGVVGLALCSNAYGEPGLALASILMASMTVIYNILSVVVLSAYQGQERINWLTILRDIGTNPLILAILLALLVAALQLPVPQLIQRTGQYLGSLALPLALLGTGASMNLRALRHSSLVALLCVVMKTLLLPALVTLGAWYLGYGGMELAVLFLLFVSPTATASYIMVKSMGGNDVLAANIIMVTTVVALFTASFGLFLLNVLKLV